MNYYIYDRIPGQHPSYSVAVLATSRTDAKKYMERYWGGGVFARQVDGGEVRADCGAVTQAASEQIRAHREEEK